RADGPPIVIGGNGPKRTLPLVARYADEWNAVFQTAAGIVERNAIIDGLLEKEGRKPSDVKRTLMIRGVIGKTEADLAARFSAEELADMRSREAIVGTPGEIVERLGKLSEVGVAGVQLQWLDLD